MKERLVPFKPKDNGSNPRWVIYPQVNGEHDIIGPLKKASAELLARDTGGVVFVEQPDLKDKKFINLVTEE